MDATPVIAKGSEGEAEMNGELEAWVGTGERAGRITGIRERAYVCGATKAASLAHIL